MPQNIRHDRFARKKRACAIIPRQKLFSNVYDPVRTVSTKPAAFDGNSGNVYVSKLTGNPPSGGQGRRIGPSLVLKVMAGDKVQINTFAYYNGATQTPVSDNTLLTDLLSTLVSGVTAQSGGKIGSGNATAVSNAVSPNVLSFLNNRTYNSSLPKAYLNWVLLDNQFKYVASNSSAMQVQPGSSKQPLVAPLQTMAKNGYLYMYVSNQSPQDVYFDDLIVTHTTGPLVQEQSYYPFGLQMAGISDKAMLKLDSKNKFNGGVELEEDYGVNLYETDFREYDPQLGRFTGVDALAELAGDVTPYQFAVNDPIYWNDPSGLKATTGGNPPGWHWTGYGWSPDVGEDGGGGAGGSYISFAEWDYFVSSFGGGGGGGGGGNGGGNNQYHGGGNGGSGSNADESNNNPKLPGNLSNIPNTLPPIFWAMDTVPSKPINILKKGLKLAAATIILGGGPEDPAADIAAAGEIVVAAVIAGVVYLFSDDLDRIAQDIISEDRKGSINREFPDQYRNETLKDIEKTAKGGDQLAKKALKLLRDGRFKK